MLKILVIICVLLAFLSAVLCESWLRKYRGKGEELAKIIGVVRGRNNNFWSFQYIPVIIAVIIISISVGAGIGWKSACIFAAGAVVSFAAVLIGSRTMISGTAASFHSVRSGDVRRSFRASYRTGTVMGLVVSGCCVAAISLLFFFMKVKKVMAVAACLALGASTTALFVQIGGLVYTSAYILASPDEDFADRTGTFAGTAADVAGSYFTAVCSAIILAEAAVLSSGVTSPLTVSSAAKFPVIVSACGIIASMLGTVVYRASSKSDSSVGASVSTFISAAVMIAVSVYFSTEVMDSLVYAWSLGAGTLAGLLISELSRFFSPDSRVFILGLKDKRKLGKNMPVIFDLGTGMTSIIINIVIILAAIFVAYKFSGYYGIALCAVGMVSVSVSTLSVSGLSVVSPTVSEMLSGTEDPAIEKIRDSFDITSSRSWSVSNSFHSTAAITSAIAMFFAFAYLTDRTSVNALSASVFGGLFTGAAASFVLMGLVIGSVSVTGRVALRDILRNDDETGAVGSLRGSVLPAVAAILFPTVIGLFLGIDALAGFLLSAIATGYMLVATLSNSGSHFENTASQSLNSILKTMIVFSIVFLPLLLKIGGLIH